MQESPKYKGILEQPAEEGAKVNEPHGRERERERVEPVGRHGRFEATPEEERTRRRERAQMLRSLNRARSRK